MDLDSCCIRKNKFKETIGNHRNWWHCLTDIQTSSFPEINVSLNTFGKSSFSSSWKITETEIFRTLFYNNVCSWIKKWNAFECHHKSTTVNKVQMNYLKALWVCNEMWFLWQIVIESGNPNSLSPVLKTIIDWNPHWSRELVQGF